MPEQIKQEINLETSKYYDFYIKNGFLKNPEMYSDSNFEKFTNMRKLCSVYSKEKFEAFTDLINSTKDRTVVFYNFNEELKKLRLITKNRPQSIISGEYKNLENFEKFEDSILFAQYRAAAMGQNLQISNKTIFLSPPLESDLFRQAHKRIHRIGQTKTCFYWYLLCKDSIETRIMNILERRINYTKSLFEKDFCTEIAKNELITKNELISKNELGEKDEKDEKFGIGEKGEKFGKNFCTEVTKNEFIAKDKLSKKTA